MMTTRVRRRRPRVPPRKGFQPLPQFGAGGIDAIDWENLFLTSVPFMPTIKRPKQKGGRLDELDKTFLRGFKGLFQLTNYVRRQKEKRQKGGRIKVYIKRRTSM